MIQTVTKKQNDYLWSLGQKFLDAKDRTDYLARLRLECDRMGIGLVFLEDERFPETLRQIEDPPAALFYRGDLSVAKMESVAIVGTRNSSAYGEKAAYGIARACAREGLAVVSGMARGIDSCAHKGALDTGGKTIAFLPGGLDRCYPPSNTWLFERTAQTGLLLSEYPPGMHTEKWNFLKRNRLISGISLGTVVVQAAGRSGAVNTAQHAIEQGKDLFAVPGSIFELNSVGVHRLIADGAEIVNSVDMVAERYRARQITIEQQAQERSPAGAWGWLYEAIDDFGSVPEEIVAITGKNPEKVQTGLTILELQGLIERREGHKIYRK